MQSLESEDFLFPLSCMVESITIGDGEDREMRPLPRPTIKYMLQQKCNCIEINDNSTFLSGTDAENLIQVKNEFIFPNSKFFQIGHHLSKRITLKATTKSDDFALQMGNYSIKVYEDRIKYMQIQHIQM